MLNFSNPAAGPEQLYAAAVQHHMAGRGAEAEGLYRQVLAAVPGHADTWHMLGVLACQAGKPEAAVGLMERAAALDPSKAAYRCNLGEAHRLSGREERAEAEYKAAIGLDGRMADAYTNLAALYSKQGRDAESLAAAQAVAAFAPENAAAHRFMGDALGRLRRNAEALAAYERALALQPNFSDVRFNAGLLMVEAGRAEDAAAAFRAVVAGAPEDWDARLQLADALDRLGRVGEAHQELLALLKGNPNYVQAHSRLANLLRNADRVDEALVAYARVKALDPADWITQANMSFALRDQARLGEALALQRELVAKHPEAVALHSGMIFTMHLLPETTRAEIQREQEAWNRRHGDPVAAQRGGYGNGREAGRRLKVGYVSADLRAHPVGWFMLPLVRNHDRGRVEVYCYQTGRGVDAATREFRGAADQFRSLGFLNDDEAAAAIRADGIDILVDLSNHTIDNRMPVFARKPAPVQISYLAFCAGTGVETFDWRLTDGLIDPVGSGGGPDDAAAFEKPLRLAETYWCYAPRQAAGEVTPLPALADGGAGVTLGSFNYFSKCNDTVLALWARLLVEMPAARFMLNVPSGSRQAYVREFFAARGVSPERLTLVGRIREDLYFANYGRVDIALDTFPWAGGTTTCDALWMGVPVVTLAGGAGRTLQRGGVSILSNLGHPEWIAHSEVEYIGIVEQLAADLPRLAVIRAALRDQMRASVLMDAPRFARNIEAAYRQAWQHWCAG